MEMINKNLGTDEIVALMDYLPLEQLKEVEEKIKEKRLSNIEKAVGETTRGLTLVNKEVKSLKGTIKTLEEELEKVTKETDGITKTFMTNGEEKRQCEKYMHALIYKEFEKDSIRDQLLHGYLTGKCKKHLVNTFPNVGSFNWLRIEDVDTITGVVKSYLSSGNIHKLSKKRVNDLHKEKENRKNLKNITPQKARQYELLELLLEEVGYDKDLI